MADLRKHSATSNLIRFVLKHATSGIGLTGLSSASSGLIISTIADNEATATVYTVAASNVETITTLGTYAAPTASKCRFKEVDATNHKGLYEFQFADARFSVASAKRLVISVTGATNLLDADYEIQLVAYDPQSATSLGLSKFADIEGDTQDIQSRVPAALTAGGNMKADALAWAGGATDTADIALKATLAKGTDITGLNDLDAAGVRTAVGMAAANLDTQLTAIDDFLDTEVAAILAAVDTEVAAIKAKTDTIPASPASVGDIPTAATVADAVWDEDATAHQTQGTFGQAVGDPVADTNTIYKAVVTDATGATVAADVVAVKVDSAAILIDTAEIGAAGAGLTVLASQASVNTIDDFLDTEIAAILAAVDTEVAAIQTELANGTYGLSALNTDLDSLLTRLSALRAGYIDNLSAGAVGLEATLTAMKGAGWTTETLKAIKDAQQVVAIKRNQALANFTFTMVDSSGTLLTGLTVTATRRLDAGSFAACANAVVEISGGLYEINLANTDVNGAVVTLKFAATGAKTRYVTLLTQP